MGNETEVKDVRATPLSRLAAQPVDVSRFVPGYDAERVTVAAFQSSI